MNDSVHGTKTDFHYVYFSLLRWDSKIFRNFRKTNESTTRIPKKDPVIQSVSIKDLTKYPEIFKDLMNNLTDSRAC